MTKPLIINQGDLDLIREYADQLGISLADWQLERFQPATEREELLARLNVRHRDGKDPGRPIHWRGGGRP